MKRNTSVSRSTPVSDGAPLTTIRLAGVPEPFNLPWLLALERRAFVRAKIDLQWHTVHEGTGAMTKMLATGELDMAVLVTEGAVRNILSGGENTIVTTLVDTPLTWGVHVGSGTELNEKGHLKGTPYAISRPNSGSHLMAKVYAEKNGWQLTEKDFDVVNDLAGAEQRLSATEPAIFLWEKGITASLVHSGKFRRVDEITPPWPAFVVVARTVFYNKNAVAIARLMRVFRDQAKGFKEKKSSVDIVSQRYGMKHEDAKEWMMSMRWSSDERTDPAVLIPVAEALHRSGILQEMPAEADLAGLVAPSNARKK